MIKSLHFLKNHINLYKDFTYMKFQMSFDQLVDFIVGSMWETFYLFDLRINKIYFSLSVKRCCRDVYAASNQNYYCFIMDYSYWNFQ